MDKQPLAPATTHSAPGKLFLLGEYAVLESATALITAVDRRVGVRSTPAGDKQWRFTSAQIGVNNQVLVPKGRHQPPALTVCQAVLDELESKQILPPPRHVQLDSAAFFAGVDKLGLGSSAAVTVALLAHLLAPNCDSDRLFALALAAHRRAQGDAGSGGDVAAAVYGGHLAYKRNAVIEPLAPWPALGISCVRVGRPTVTGDFIAAFNAVRHRPVVRVHMQHLQELADAGIGAWREQATGDFVDISGRYGQAMARLGELCEQPVVSPAHRQLMDWALANGLGYKPSGAGGGDVGLFFAADAQACELPAALLQKAGAQRLDLSFGAPGGQVG